MKGSTIFILVILLICVLGFLGITRLTDYFARTMSEEFQVAVDIDSMSATPNKIGLKRLQFGNAAGYSLPRALSVRESKIYSKLSNYFKDDITIEEISLDAIYLGLEFDSNTSAKGNWTVIMSNFKNAADKHIEKYRDRHTVLIKKLVITNINTQVLFRDGSAIRNLPLIDRIELNNLSSEGPLPRDQIMGTVLAQMLKEIFREHHLNDMLESIILSPEKAVDEMFKPVESIFGK